MKNQSVSEIVELLRNEMKFLRNEYNVKTIGIFGSFVRNELDSLSDVDILVEFTEPIGFFKFIQLENYLSKLVKRKVDLVTKNALKPMIKNEVLKEVVSI